MDFTEWASSRVLPVMLPSGSLVMVMMEPSAVRVTSGCTPTPGGGGGGAVGFSQDESDRAIRTHSPGRQDTAVLAVEVLDSFMFVYLNLFIQSIPTDSRLKSKYVSRCTHW